MKKQITMFLAVAMAAGMMAGCSGGKAQTNASGTAAVSDTAAPETTQADTTTAVSYTHLDVYKRQSINVLTDGDHPSPLAKGNPQHTNLVEVQRAGN